MKSEIRNIINLENITKLRSSLNIAPNMPLKNTIINFLKYPIKSSMII